MSSPTTGLSTPATIKPDCGTIIFQKNDPRQVMQKLGSLIEEGGVVFVAFNDEVRPIGHLKAAPKILRNATDKK